jgi:hypothetical protein
VLRELREDLVLVGKTALRVLREDEPPISEDVELSRRAGDWRGFEAELRGDLACETRSACVVPASGRAVVDLDRHSANPSHRDRLGNASPIQARAMALDDRRVIDAGRKRPVAAPAFAAETSGAEGVRDLRRRMTHEE